jgi:glycosyltransferase involved in cell wall biosynthesis
MLRETGGSFAAPADWCGSQPGTERILAGSRPFRGSIALRLRSAWKLRGARRFWNERVRPAKPLLAAWRTLLPHRRKPAPAGGGPLLVVMVVISDVRNDPRVQRAALALARTGYQVKILFPDSYAPRLAEKAIDWGPGISFRALEEARQNYIFVYPWIFDPVLVDKICEEKPFAIHCHDLTTCLVGMAAAAKLGCYCVCDFHEWYSENVSWDGETNSWAPHPPLKRRIYQWVERLVTRRADVVITVCDSIADDISKELAPRGRRIHVVRNIPPIERADLANASDLKKELGLGDDKFLLLWSGGIGPSRLIEPIIEAVARVPDCYFAIRTPYWGAFGKPYEELAARLGISDRIIRLPAVPSIDVVRAAVGADAGVWSLPNISRNFYYALGNKVFEYLAAGLPILVANYPEPTKLVREHDIGDTFDPYDPASIAAAIERLRVDPQRRAELRGKVQQALKAIDADKEWQLLVDLYRQMPRQAPAQ